VRKRQRWGSFCVGWGSDWMMMKEIWSDGSCMRCLSLEERAA